MNLQNQNILFIVRTMGLGGTENVVLQLCEILSDKVNKIVVCSSGGVHEKKLQEMGIKHYLIPDIASKNPMDMLKSCRSIKRIIDNDNIKQIYLLGSEGTIESEVYQTALAQKGIKCQVPEKEQYVLLRECIEAVKQNKYTDEVESIFEKLVGEYEMPVILGCTELPILYEKYRDNIEGAVYDPLQIALKLLKKEYDNE